MKHGIPSTGETMKFHISYPALIAFCGAIILATVLAAWPKWPIALCVGGLSAAYFSVIVRRFPITLSEHGLLLYRRNWLPWEEVVSAKRLPVPLLPYLVITRPRGMRWWVPLYYTSDRSLSDALSMMAPADNPIHDALSIPGEA